MTVCTRIPFLPVVLFVLSHAGTQLKKRRFRGEKDTHLVMKHSVELLPAILHYRGVIQILEYPAAGAHTRKPLYQAKEDIKSLSN